MLIQFASPQMADAAFSASLLYATGVVGAMCLVFMLGSVGYQRLISTKNSLAISCIFLCLAIAIPYAVARHRFSSIEVTDQGVSLIFQAPAPREIFIPKNQINSILFGLGKHGSPCHIRVELRTGTSHRSLAVDKDARACKRIHAEINAVLHP